MLKLRTKIPRLRVLDEEELSATHDSVLVLDLPRQGPGMRHFPSTGYLSRSRIAYHLE